MAKPATAAAVYVRISSDPTGQRLGVARQLKECQAKAATLGWAITRTYEDNDVSASTGKRRPAYEQMLSDLEAGVVNAVVVWDLDRLTRRPIEIEHFIDLADRRKIALASVGGDVDLSTDNGRMFARIKGAVARAEVERKSARQKAANAQRAAAGLPHASGRAFGYTPDGMKVVPQEAAEIRRAVEALLAGASIHSITRDLNARQILTTKGGPWRNTEVRRMVGNPRYAALRRYRDQTLAGRWPAVIDADMHRSVLGVLSDPRRTKAGPPRQHLLSGVATCSECGGRIFGVMEKTKGVLYRCESRRHVNRQAAPIDALVTTTLLERLSRPDAVDLFSRQQGDENGAARLRKQEVTLRARLDALAEDYAAGLLDRAQLQAGSARLHADLEAVTAELDGMVRSPALADLASASDVEATWNAFEVDRKRAIIGLLVTVRLDPPGRGARRFDTASVHIEWRAA
ncbi:recombinase family protein [Acidothermaceae bacterium B102]|nr:recombinase family protein [Acidothermaceae bacterium B102]